MHKFWTCFYLSSAIYYAVMSLDHNNYTVMRAVQLGACDFWVKPLRYYQFKNMRTHVLRKSLKENKIQTKDCVGSLEDDEWSRKRGKDNSEFGSSSVVRDQSNSSSKEAEESKHRVSSMKKPRVVWIAELHSKFVNAVKKLGLHRMIFQLFNCFSLFTILHGFSLSV